MWTTELIELFATGYAPQGWQPCPTCKVEYHSAMRAYVCYKAHTRVHERVYADLKLDVKKHEVSFDDDKPLCRSCVKGAAREAERALTVVQMEHPPVCSRCQRQIEDPPFVELQPQRLPLSERHRDLILKPDRPTLGVLQDHSLHKGLKDWHPETGSPVVDPRLWKEFGPVIQDGRGGTPRTATGYIEVDEDAEEVPCELPTC